MDGEAERRPHLNYLDMGFSPGDRVVFEGFTDEVVTVADGRTLHWNGGQTSLRAVRKRLGERQGLQTFSGGITIAGRDLNEAYDETYGPLAGGSADAAEGELTFAEVVPSPELLMGVKAVWGRSNEPVMCFGSRGEGRQRYQLARNTAEKAVDRPFLVTIGGGAQVPAPLAGRVLELVRVTPAYGETSAFVRDPALRERLAQWPVAVTLLEVYSVLGEPHLVADLGFPGRGILTNAYDTVKSDDADLRELWEALKDRPVTYRSTIRPPDDFRAPTKPEMFGSLYPKLSAKEGERRYQLALVAERDPKLKAEAKRQNFEKNAGVYVCEACDMADSVPAMFDVHHIWPISAGVRETHLGDLVVLCPTCHRWAHRKAETRHTPLSVADVRAARTLIA